LKNSFEKNQKSVLFFVFVVMIRKHLLKTNNLYKTQ